MQEFNFGKWVRDIEMALRVKQEHEKLRANAKETAKYQKKRACNYFAGQQICRLNKKYDNNVSVEMLIKHGKKTEQMAHKTSIEPMSKARRHAEFVFAKIFNVG